MTRLLAITKNTLLQTVRQPIYGLVVLATLGSLALAPSMTGWTLDDDNKLLRDLGLSTLLVQGLFLAAFGAAGVISVEIEDKTILTVAVKPVRRITFILGKYLGVLLAMSLAHYLAILGLLLTLRHGVLQTAADKSDPTVLLAGPGVMLLVVIFATVANYLFDWKFLTTTVVVGVLALSLSTFCLLFVDRNFRLRTYECTQDVPGLPKEIDPQKDFRGLIAYRDTTEVGAREKKGVLIRSEWLGPISDEDRAYLMSLSEDMMYKKCINFLVIETRKLVTPQMFKAAVLLFGVLAMLTAFAVAVSTRVNTAWTLLLTLMLLAGGLVSDFYLTPWMAANDWRAIPATIGSYALPNIQYFWMIDAISEDKVIPLNYMLGCFGYAACYSLALLAIGAALFETREVG